MWIGSTKINETVNESRNFASELSKILQDFLGPYNMAKFYICVILHIFDISSKIHQTSLNLSQISGLGIS
jgi:hypothetical protein